MVRAGLTEEIARWAVGLRYEDVPAPVLDRARLQIASVLGAVFAGSATVAHARLREAARRWGSGDDAHILPSGPRAPLHAACYLNAAASVALDYDDYLFAGHTGHSSVLGALAVGETTKASGCDVLAAQVAANEVGGRLGASLLFGPHNGQMWACIHALSGAVVAGRLLGLDAERMRHAIGLALAQPPYPLAPAFFGPDSKALLASGPLVEGVRAAECAAAGMTGAEDILGDPKGLLASFSEHGLPFAFSGLGSAWVTESLAYKLYPGCAYVDTPVDALERIREDFRAQTGRALSCEDVGSIRVEATLFTWGMEQMSAPYRSAGPLRAADVNFSVALSFGTLLAAGELSAATLSAEALERRRELILAVAARVSVEHDGALTGRTAGLADVGIDVGRYLAANRGRLGARGDVLAAGLAAGAPAPGGAGPAEPYEPTLEGADFSRLAMRFPARVSLETRGGERYSAEQEIALGAAGRPLEEVRRGVREKFLRNASHLRAGEAEDVLRMIAGIDAAPDVREVMDAVVGGGVSP